MPCEPEAPCRVPDPLDLPLKLGLARLSHGISPASVLLARADWLMHLATSPGKLATLWASAARRQADWAAFALQALAGAPDEAGAPWQRDARFHQPQWRQPPFSVLAHAFLQAQDWWQEAACGVHGVSRHHEAVNAFTLRQWLDMASPSNFLPTNPEVLAETARTGGANLASGLANWWRDALEVGRGGRARGLDAFRPGEAVALTPGKVVMRNALVELIQYQPATPQVDREPVLIIPSWIMKYYILDLTPDDSLVRWLVGRGHTVFMVSWRNPGPEEAHLGMDDYLQLGVMAAIQAVRRIRPEAGIQAMGYCLGGTLLAMAAALLGAHGDTSLRSLTLLAAQVDFEEPGELGLFIDESQIAFLEDVMAEHGYLDGRRMAGAFQLINSKDLVWSKLVHEYLMGAQTPMTALRAWNADATRMPARMHSEYLRRLYLHNDLAEGRYRALGETVDLGRVKVPLFVVATERDHVSPWPSVWRALRLMQAPATFVLCGGGHNVGIVNPPEGPLASPRASFRLVRHGPSQAPADAASVLREAQPQAGSWWPAWGRWLGRHASGHVPATPVTGLRVDGRELDAPGDYVHQT